MKVSLAISIKTDIQSVFFLFGSKFFHTIVAFREGSVKHVYFVAETKGNDIEVSQLRRAEDAKIECARRHFAAISTGDVVYSVVKTYQDLYNAVTK